MESNDPDLESNDGWGDALPTPDSDDEEEDTPPPNDNSFEESEATEEIFLGRGEAEESNNFGTLNEEEDVSESIACNGADWWPWTNQEVNWL